MILLKISQPGKSWKIILPKINSLGKFCKIDSSQKFPVPEKSAKVIPSMLSWMGKYYLASNEIHFGVFSSLTKKMCACADSNSSQNILTEILHKILEHKIHPNMSFAKSVPGRIVNFSFPSGKNWDICARILTPDGRLYCIHIILITTKERLN